MNPCNLGVRESGSCEPTLPNFARLFPAHCPDVECIARESPFEDALLPLMVVKEQGNSGPFVEVEPRGRFAKVQPMVGPDEGCCDAQARSEALQPQRLGAGAADQEAERGNLMSVTEKPWARFGKGEACRSTRVELGHGIRNRCPVRVRVEEDVEAGAAGKTEVDERRSLAEAERRRALAENLARQGLRSKFLFEAAIGKTAERRAIGSDRQLPSFAP